MDDRIELLRKIRQDSIELAKKYFVSPSEPDFTYFSFRNCPVCEYNNCKIIYQNDSGFNFVRCLQCRMVYMNPTLKRDYVEKAYINSKEFSVKYQLWDESVKNLKPVKEQVKSDRYDLLVKYAKGGSLLDFGCGFGKITDKLKFYFHTIEGVEIDRFCATHAEQIFGFKVYTDLIETLNFENKYDAILSYNSIEHVYDPKTVLEYLFKALKAGGVIYIECPNIDSVSVRLFGGKHHLLQSNEHLNMFDLRTIRNLLVDVGFETVEWRTRKLDVLTNDLIVYLLKRKHFYHRCCSALMECSMNYKSFTKIVDRVLEELFARVNNQICYFGSYVQIIAKKRYDK